MQSDLLAGPEARTVVWMSAGDRSSLAPVAVICAACIACSVPRMPSQDARAASALNPQATFAAHQVHAGFVLDRLQPDATGVVEQANVINWGFVPEFRVRTAAGDVGDLRLTSPASVTVRESGVRNAGQVAPAWDNGAIRFTLRPATGAPLRFGPFERIDGGAGYSVLSRNALTLLDVEGTYRATVFDEHDQPVGWWEVEVVEPFRPHVFVGVLPGTSPAAQAGVMLALNSEIDWIENHVLDVWRGLSGGRGGSHLGGVR
jgi:hypothetical protein